MVKPRGACAMAGPPPSMPVTNASVAIVVSSRDLNMIPPQENVFRDAGGDPHRLAQPGSLGTSPVPAVAPESAAGIELMDHMGWLLLEGPPAWDGRGARPRMRSTSDAPCVTATSVRDAASG